MNFHLSDITQPGITNQSIYTFDQLVTLSFHYKLNKLLSFQSTTDGLYSYGDNKIGDIQGANNIASNSNIYFYRLNGILSFSHNKIIAGIQDCNIHFDNEYLTSLLFNSSFGINPVLSLNNKASIYPDTHLGVTYIHSFHQLQLKGGVYKLNTLFSIVEMDYSYKNTIYMFGFWNKYRKSGYYFSVQEFFEPYKIGIFFEYGIGNRNDKVIRSYLSSGILINNDFSFGFSKVYLINKKQIDYDLTYRYFLNHNLSLQPDIQLIEPKSIVTLFLRFQISI